MCFIYLYLYMSFYVYPHTCCTYIQYVQCFSFTCKGDIYEASAPVDAGCKSIRNLFASSPGTLRNYPTKPQTQDRSAAKQICTLCVTSNDSCKDRRLQGNYIKPQTDCGFQQSIVCLCESSCD